MQNKNKGLKITLTVFFIIALALTAIFAVGYIMNAYTVPEKVIPLNDFLNNTLKVVKSAFIYPFNKTHPDVIYGASQYETEGQYLSVCISTYVAIGIAFVMLVLGIVNCVVKKAYRFIGFSALIVVNLFIAIMDINMGKFYYQTTFTAVGASDGFPWYRATAGLALFAGALAPIATFVTYVLGLVYLSKSQEVTKEENEALDFEPAQLAIAEEAVIPEAVQEGEEIPAEEYVSEEEMTVEPEEEHQVETFVAPVLETEATPAETPAQPEEKEEAKPEPAPAAQAAPAIDQNSLASLLREVVRDIVRDELARSNANQQQSAQPQQNGSSQQITGATFGGPLVVQYFNGGINGVSQPAPAPVETAAPVQPVAQVESKPVVQAQASAPVAPKPEAKPAPVKPAPVPAPVVEEKPEEQKEAKIYERLTFAERLLQSDKELHDLYNEIKNEILSYGVKSRVSAVGDTFRLHKKMYVRITVAGKSLKLYFALDPKEYANSTIPVQDASNKALYEEIPLCFKVKSGLSVRRCKELIQAVMEQDSLEQGEIQKVNWVKELKAELAAGKKD